MGRFVGFLLNNPLDMQWEEAAREGRRQREYEMHQLIKGNADYDSFSEMRKSDKTNKDMFFRHAYNFGYNGGIG
ncbi:hypothetical protein KY343_06325 [Candidatus Woesearchaeota archaeon]|nr:hypothetical protein [Candidatus Woesearchaeota archaeon]